MGAGRECENCGKHYEFKEGSHVCDPADALDMMRADYNRREELAREGSPEMRSLYEELMSVVVERDVEGYVVPTMKAALRLGQADFRMVVVAIVVGESFRGDRESYKIGSVIQRIFRCAEELTTE